MFFKKEKTKHLSASITKNSIINFEKRPSYKTLKDFKKNGINSDFSKELIYLLDLLKKNHKVKKVKIRSLLLNDKNLSKPIIEILKKYGCICVETKSNIVDKISLVTTSIVTLNGKNLRRIKNNPKVKECIIYFT